MQKYVEKLTISNCSNLINWTFIILQDKLKKSQTAK
jgi:hypothetical protein